MDFIWSIVILAGGVLCAWFYMRKPALPDDPKFGELLGHRPWRRLGAAICLLLAIMFVLGIHLLDAETGPRAYVTYWVIMLLLALWLCVLAVRDLLHTRRAIARLRDRHLTLDRVLSPPEETSGETEDP